MNWVMDTEKGGIGENSVCMPNDKKISLGIYSFDKMQGAPTMLSNSCYKFQRHNFERKNSYWK